MGLYSVRKATRKDVNAIVELGAQVHKESAFAHMEYSIGKCQALCLDAIDEARGFWIRVIEYNRQVIGVMIAQVVETYFGRDRVAHDLLLAVAKEHRGKAFIALQTVTEQYHSWARSNGAKRVFLSTSTGIEPDKVEKLFDVLGFQKIGTIHEA